MTALLTITVAGTPVGASRPRVGRRGVYSPDAHIAWEEAARQLAAYGWRGLSPYDGLVAVEVVAHHHRPQRLCRRRDPREAIRASAKPDLDNVCKLVLDALVKAGVLVDDTRVAVLHAERWYTPIDDHGTPTAPERVVVTVMETT